MQINGLIAAEGGGAILIPHAADLIWGSVSFVILLILFSKYVLPRFNKVLAERAEKIEGGLKRAERAQAEADAAFRKYNEQLEVARQEAAEIRAAAADEKRVVIAQAATEAEAKALQIAQRAAESLDSEKAQAEAALQREVGALALDLASKVIGESLKEDARARSVVDAYIADLERQASEAGR